MLNIQEEKNETFLIKKTFDKKLKQQIITYEDNDGKKQELKINKEEGSDGMSDKVYPYSVFLYDLEGGGDCKGDAALAG